MPTWEARGPARGGPSFFARSRSSRFARPLRDGVLGGPIDRHGAPGLRHRRRARFCRRTASPATGPSPAAGWSATSFLATIACVEPSGAPATPRSPAAPILAALATSPHQGLLSSSDQGTLAAWVAAGAPAFVGAVHLARHRRPEIERLPRSVPAERALVCHARRGRPERVRPMPRRDARASPRRDSVRARRDGVHDLPLGAGRAARVQHLPRLGHAHLPAARPLLLPGRRADGRSARGARRAFDGERVGHSLLDLPPGPQRRRGYRDDRSARQRTGRGDLRLGANWPRSKLRQRDRRMRGHVP